MSFGYPAKKKEEKKMIILPCKHTSNDFRVRVIIYIVTNNHVTHTCTKIGGTRVDA